MMRPQHIKVEAPFQRCAICGEHTRAPIALCDFCEVQLTEEYEAERYRELNSQTKHKGDVK